MTAMLTEADIQMRDAVMAQLEANPDEMQAPSARCMGWRGDPDRVHRHLLRQTCRGGAAKRVPGSGPSRTKSKCA